MSNRSKFYIVSGCECLFRHVVIVIACAMTCVSYTEGASTNDAAMESVYCLLPAMLSGESLSVPLLCPWSSPIYAAIPQGYSVSNVYSRGTARISAYEQAFKGIWGRMENWNSVETEDGYEFIQQTGPGMPTHTRFRVLNWKSLPLKGEWRAQANDGRCWSGHLNRLAELPGPTTGQEISDLLLTAVLNQLPDESKNARAIGIRIQVDGHMYPVKGPGGFPGTLIDGAFVAGYLVDGQRAGLWVTARSSGGLSLAYYVSGSPYGMVINYFPGIYYSDTNFVCSLEISREKTDTEVSLKFHKGRIIELRCFPDDARDTCVQAIWTETGKVKSLWMDATPKTQVACGLLGN